MIWLEGPKTFDDLLTRIDKFTQVKEDDLAANRADYKRDRENDTGQEGSSKENKKEEGSTEILSYVKEIPFSDKILSFVSNFLAIATFVTNYTYRP